MRRWRARSAGTSSRSARRIRGSGPEAGATTRPGRCRTRRGPARSAGSATPDARPTLWARRPSAGCRRSGSCRIAAPNNSGAQITSKGPAWLGSSNGTHHLMQENAGGNGHVERFSPRRQADPDPAVAPRQRSSGLNAGPFVADHQRERVVAAESAAASGLTASPSAVGNPESAPVAAAAQATSSSGVGERPPAGGSRAHAAAQDFRVGEVGRALERDQRRRRPSPSAVRSMRADVARVLHRIQTPDDRRRAAGGISSSDQTRGSTTATTPCGCSVSASSSSSAAERLDRRTPCS